MRRLVMLPVFLLLLAFPASATNVTSMMLIEQYGYTPSNIFMFIFAVAITTLIASYRWNDDMCAIIAFMASFLALWTSRSIDFVTGVAIDSTSTITTVHTIYHPEVITVGAGICFILSLLNGYRLYLVSKTSDSMGSYK